MKKDMITIPELADQQLITINYSDDDIIVTDTVKQLAESNQTRIHMNLIVVAKKGKVQLQINGQPMLLCENQLLMCPPGTVFSDFMLSPDFSFKAIFLTTSIIQSFLHEKMNIWNEMMYIHKLHVATMEPRDINFFYHFHDALTLLFDAPPEHYPYRTEVIQSLVRSAMLGLCGVLKQMSTTRQEPLRSQPTNIFQHFLNLVNSNKLKSATVEDYASELCISSKYLSEICKRNSGKTAGQWIREHTLEEIRYYLKQTDLPINQIAERLGLSSPSFLGKFVKKHFGMTPLQFRQNISVRS